MEPVSIPARFNGPPASANGGFTCGLLAGAMGARAAQVSLRLPPPLETPMTVHRDGDRWELRDGADVVADGIALDEVEAEPPAAVSPRDAGRASERYPWYEGHIYPTCFVCGPDRPARDGLGVFAGPLEGDGVHAAAWTPAAEWADAAGAVREEIVWAALDCPSAVPVMATGGAPTPAALARLSASLEGPVRAGEPHAVMSWRLGTDGRKLHSASAIMDAEGTVLARARALWIALAAPMGSEAR